MDIKEMNMEEVETRSAELAEQINDENADLDAIETEVQELEERKATILRETEERKKGFRKERCPGGSHRSLFLYDFFHYFHKILIFLKHEI